MEYEEKDFLNYSYKFQQEESELYDYDYSKDRNNALGILDESYNSDLEERNYSWINFRNLVERKKIKIAKKPTSTFGWFMGEKSSMKDDLIYTYEKYLEGISEHKSLEREKRPMKRREDKQFIGETNRERILTMQKNFEKKYPDIIRIFKEQKKNSTKQLYTLFEEDNSEDVNYDYLIENLRKEYNLKKDKYNENVRNFSNLSPEMKEQTRNMGKNLDKFLKDLKPHILDYDARKTGDFRNLNTRILDEEKKKADELRQQQKLQEEKRQKELKQANEEIQNLNYKIMDASGRYAANKGKLKAAEFKLQKLEKLEKRKKELQEKIRSKNLSIKERQNILKEKTDLNQKLANIDSLKNQVADLRSKIPDASIFEQEKTLRENELEKYRKMNDASIREKNALFRSLELEKMKQEISIREEQRYQEEQRQEEELKQAKIVFLKEKKIAERKLNEIQTQNRVKNSRIVELKKVEQDLSFQKIYFEKIKAEKQSALKEKKLQIEQAKLKTLELEKQKLAQKQDFAEQQKLFADSIQRDIDELNDQKNVLKNLTSENKKILSNTKKEISARQTEIEKNIKLNLETVKEKEHKILAEESKIKLDVFTTLSDVKEQTAIKLDVENILSDLKDEIIRKQDVSDLLSETIDKISNNEISEVENYNAFLEKEIEFKKKLEKENLTLADYKEIVAEEKEDLIERLEHVKSKKLEKIYQLREKAIESQMKIILIEGSEDLKSNLFSLKYEIENLEKEKEISERKEDLAKFQSDNFKRELKLRKQEIELLKNIRLKVLETERRTRKNEARSAIEDIVKSIEKNERDAEVREKLDEIIDDVEDIRISQNTKNVLSKILDKIEDREIHDAAQEKVDFILDKIEDHDNIEESKKALEKIINKVEDREIYKNVWLRLEDVLDYVEGEEFHDNEKDYYQNFFKHYQELDEDDDFSIKTEDLEDEDFLEDDELDDFISNVKKHISGEKKMEQFSKIDKILNEVKEEDFKLKMDENIEMKDRSQRVEAKDYDVGETSFAEFDDYNLFVNNIENPEMRNKVKLVLDNEDAFDKDKPEKMKKAYVKTINALWQTDKLDTDYWDGNIILEERAKLKYEQKVNNLNTALTEYNLHIDPTDLNVRTFLDIKITETFSGKRGEINGYSYNGEKIISRNISRNFYFNYIKKPSACQNFIDTLKNKINNTAKSQIAAESFFEGKSVKDCALEYIGELREEQNYQMESARNSTEMKKALRDGNDIEKEIENIKKNISFKMRLKIFRRTVSWRFTKLLRFLWKHKGKTASLVGGLIIAGIGVLLNQLGVIAVVHQLKKAAAGVKQYADDVHAMGKKIIQNVQALYRVPGTIIGYVMILLSIFLRILYFTTRLSGTYSSAAVFGALGVTFEALIYFEGSAEKINEKVADAMEETGNVIENFGIAAQKRIIKNSPRWYWDKPTDKKTVLEIVESGATKMIYSFAKGTQKAGKKIEKASEVVRNSIWYLKIFVLITIIFLTIIFTRNYIL